MVDEPNRPFDNHFAWQKNQPDELFNHEIRDPTHVVLERRWQRVFCPLRKPSENSWVSSRYPVCLGLISMFDVGILF